jgi:hypothetical protein
MVAKRMGFSDRLSLAASALLAFNSGLLVFADNVLSDFAFLFLVLLGLYGLMAWRRGSLATSVALGAVLFAAYAFRDVGIFLFAALACMQLRDLLTHRDLKAGFMRYAAPYAVFALGFALIKIAMPAHYAGNLMGLMKNVGVKDLLENAAYYYRLMADLNFNPLHEEPLPSIFGKLFAAGFALVSVVGVFMLCKKKQWAIVVFTALIMAMYIVWPWREGYRFIFPALPGFILFALFGAYSLVRALRMPIKTWMWMAVLAVLVWLPMVLHLLLLAVVGRFWFWPAVVAGHVHTIT